MPWPTNFGIKCIYFTFKTNDERIYSALSINQIRLSGRQSLISVRTVEFAYDIVDGASGFEEEYRFYPDRQDTMGSI